MEEVAVAEAAPPPDLAADWKHRHDHQNQSHYDQIQPHHHVHEALHSTSILTITIISISIFLLICVLLFVLILQRLKSARSKNAATNSKDSNNHIHSIINATFSPHSSTINFNSSPEVKGGCLYGGRGAAQIRYKGVQVFTYKQLEIATQTFCEANLIGNGGFGKVYKGVLSDGTMAAIKMLHPSQGKQRERAFRVEVDLLSRLQSPYLVELLGYCADQNHRLLIFEFMPQGTLQHHLHENVKSPALGWGTRLRIALDCARALEFLHEYAVPSVIHRNFKCTNVLLDHNFRATVSGFGWAKMGSDKINGQVSTRVLGTTGYLAPEYGSTGKLTSKSDVYSYGVVLLELLTGRVPVDIKRPQGEHVLVSWALPRLTSREKLMEMVDPAIKGQYLTKDLIHVAAIAAMCVQSEADYRPLMTDVVQSLIPLVSMGSSASSRFLNQTSSRHHG